MISPTGKGIRKDSEGDGHYGSSRGGRLHDGIDWLADAGQEVRMPISKGRVLRYVQVYPDSTVYRGMIIEGKDGKKRVFLRLFYVNPSVPVDPYTYIKKGQRIGVAQNIAARYGPNMKNHIHMESFNHYNYYEEVEPWKETAATGTNIIL